MSKDDNRRGTGLKTMDEFADEDIKEVPKNMSKPKRFSFVALDLMIIVSLHAIMQNKYVIHCKLHMKECHDPRLPPRRGPKLTPWHSMTLR